MAKTSKLAPMKRILCLGRQILSLPIGRRAALFFLFVFGVLAHASRVQAADELMAAIVKFEIPLQLQGKGPLFEKVVSSGLRSAGFSVIERKATSAKLGSRTDFETCSSEVCLLEAVRLTGASHLVQVEVHSEAASFSISVALVEGVSGRLFTESLTCVESDPCPPIPVLLERAAKVAATKAKRQAESSATTTESNDARRPIESPATLAKPPTPLPTVTEFVPLPLAVTQSTETWRRPVGWAAVAGGVALGVLGLTYQFYFDGRETDCTTTTAGKRCQHIYEDTGRALTTGLLGAASIGVGAYLLWPTWHDKGAAQVSVSANNVTFMGRF
jgi:hypothetical protein